MGHIVRCDILLDGTYCYMSHEIFLSVFKNTKFFLENNDTCVYQNNEN